MPSCGSCNQESRMMGLCDSRTCRLGDTARDSIGWRNVCYEDCNPQFIKVDRPWTTCTLYVYRTVVSIIIALPKKTTTRGV